MATKRRTRFVRGQVIWMVATILALTALGAFSYDLFFTVSLLGLLAITELTAPVRVTPEWRQQLRWVIAFGLLIFVFIVARRILLTVSADFAI